MDDLLAAATSRRRFQLFLISLFAVSSLLLAAVGLAGVLGRMVAARTREIGIRRALGARGWDVVVLVARRGVALAGAGVLLGAGAAAAATRLLSSLLFEVSPTDPAVFAAVSLLIVTVAALAATLPAWKAVRLDPLAALRRE
jgi:ABC-type antimicrobial peptide transport system permease subunit